MQRKLWSIQYLRGIAALMVVFHHARNPEPWLYNPLESFGAGAYGVDIFFVISGFVMYTAAREERVADFLLRRITRVIPLYWIATALFVGIQLSRGEGFSRLTVLRSFLLIPTYSAVSPEHIWPVLVPGWTLMYEMFFYGIFAVGLATKRLIPVLVSVILILCLIGLLFDFSNPIPRTFTNLRLLEFLSGVVIGILYSRFEIRAWAPLLAIGLVGMIAAVIYEAGLAAWIVISSLIVAGALGCEARGWVKQRRLLKILGDASYSIYLTHVMVILGVGSLIAATALSGLPQFLVVVVASLAGSVFVGLATYFFIEKPMLKVLQRAATRFLQT